MERRDRRADHSCRPNSRAAGSRSETCQCRGGVRVAHAHPVAAEQHAPLREMLLRHVLEYQRAPAGGEHRANALLRGGACTSAPGTGAGTAACRRSCQSSNRNRTAWDVRLRSRRTPAAAGADRRPRAPAWCPDRRRSRAPYPPTSAMIPRRRRPPSPRPPVPPRPRTPMAPGRERGRGGRAHGRHAAGDGRRRWRSRHEWTSSARQEIEQARGQRQQILVRVGNVDRERGPQPDAGQDRLDDAGRPTSARRACCRKPRPELLRRGRL